MYKCISEKIEDFDVKGAVRIASSDLSIAPINQETISALSKLHPSSDKPTNIPHFVSNPITCSTTSVRIALSTFKNGSSGGIDGLRPQHIKDMLACQNEQASQSLLTALSKLCSLLLAGQLPCAIQPIVCGARLCALSKKDGGIRPIAIGNTFRRLTAKIASMVVADRAGQYLRPTQLGYGTPQGCEAGVHSARTFLELSEERNETYAFLKIDFSNAFNSIKRSVFLNQCYNHFPEVYNFALMCYAEPSHLTFGTSVIKSQTGIQQGDPLGPLLFCLGIHNLTTSLSSAFNEWYLDDGALGGDVNNIIADLEKVI